MTSPPDPIPCSYRRPRHSEFLHHSRRHPIVIQSPAILEYLEEVHPTPALLPVDPAARAKIRAVASIIRCDIHPLHNVGPLNHLRKAFGRSEQAVADLIATWIGRGLSAAEALLGDEGFCLAPSPRSRTCTSFHSSTRYDGLLCLWMHTRGFAVSKSLRLSRMPSAGLIRQFSQTRSKLLRVGSYKCSRSTLCQVVAAEPWERLATASESVTRQNSCSTSSLTITTRLRRSLTRSSSLTMSGSTLVASFLAAFNARQLDTDVIERNVLTVMDVEDVQEHEHSGVRYQ